MDPKLSLPRMPASAKFSTLYSIMLAEMLLMLLTASGSPDTSFMKSLSKELSRDLEIIKIEELGVEYIKNLYSSFRYAPNIIDANQTIHEIANKIESRISSIFAALVQARIALENIQISENVTHLRSALTPCIEGKNSDLTASISKMCGNLIDLILYKTSKEQLKVDYVLQKLKSVMAVKEAIKQQYFISSYDVESVPHSPFSNCNERDHTLLWNNYKDRTQYSKRNVVLLLDHGGSLSKHHFHIVKSVAKQMISSLSEDDNVAVLTISSDWSAPQLSNECLMPNQPPPAISDLPTFTPANKTVKKLLHKFIDGVTKTGGSTNHSLGFQVALSVAEQSSIVQNTTVLVVYISRGLLSSLTEAKLVLETISKSSKNIHVPFVINTCTVIDQTRPTIYETQFMQDIALQDYQKYNISHYRTAKAGTMVAVNSTETVGFAVSHFYSIYSSNSSFNLDQQISLPLWDSVAGDLSVSFSLGTIVNDKFGLLGLDVYFANLFEEVVYFSNTEKHQYIFLMDIQGRLIIHPAFTNPMTVKQQLHFVDISHIESFPNVEMLTRRLTTEFQGMHIVAKFGSTVRYSWRRIGEWFVVCAVTRNFKELTRLPVRPFQVNWPLNESDAYGIQLVYHRLDNSRVCRHLNQVATLDAGSLYLGARCFVSPSTQTRLVDQQSLQGYMAYLQDNTRLLTNPGLKDEVKDEVAALAHILVFLRNQHMTSFKSRFIVRRYVASHNGVLEMFPGSIVNEGLEPTRRPWFLQAMEHKSRVILTPPYLDEGGAGYIVTLAYASPHAVVALDVTYGYIYRLLLNRMPFCALLNITCFLMDDRGYLIYHPNLIDPIGHGPVEKQHIVHKESLLANDILNQKLFMKKVLCTSYGGNTVQRYYRLNTSFSDVLVNSVQGEHCVSYHLAAVPGTNVFIGMVNATCNVVVTFCPCSIVDRLCLNCHRMEQRECECPCECPLDLDSDKCSSLNGSVAYSPMCPWFPEHVSISAQFDDEVQTGMEPCFPNVCNIEKDQMGCLGVTGCEWCKFDVDGSSLNNPFCASLAACFNGVVGSLTPYKKSFGADYAVSEDYFNVPVSFISLFVLGVLLILCMFYVYRRSTATQANERLYMSSTQDNHLRMSDLNLNDNYHSSGNHRDKLLQDDKPDPVSPYCVPSTYRRTPIAADSDHGYSTMTQHDESEHMSLAPVELDSLEDDLTSDNMSIHTSVSTNKPFKLSEPQHSQFTCIPKRNNCIVVPVTVHRNMETT